MNKIIFILTFSFLFASCKKNEGGFDREDDLVTDTATFLYSGSFVSNTGNMLTVQIDIATLNDLESEQTYSESVFETVQGDFNMLYDASNSFVTAATQSNSYSTVFLLNLNNRLWMQDHIIGFYLRRFLEQIEPYSAKKAAIASFDSNTSSDEVDFLSESSNELFGNSWQYLMNEFYRVTDIPEEYNSSYETSPVYLTLRLNEVIDSLTAAGDVVGQKSITLLSGYDFDQSVDANWDISNTILLAQAAGIKINYLGPGLHNGDLKRLCVETGGFICELEQHFGPMPNLYFNEQISSLGVFLENIDRILSGDLMLHRCLFKASYTDATTWQSGERVTIPILHDSLIFNVDFVIP